MRTWAIIRKRLERADVLCVDRRGSYACALYYNGKTRYCPEVLFLHRGPGVADLINNAFRSGIPIRLAAWDEPFDLQGVEEGKFIPPRLIPWVVGIYRTLPYFYLKMCPQKAWRSRGNKLPPWSPFALGGPGNNGHCSPAVFAKSNCRLRLTAAVVNDLLLCAEA